jgi:hypothetical protein
MTATQELQSFYQFADERLRNGGGDQTLDELYSEWRASHPASKELETNVLAVKASLRDMDQGERGRPLEEFAAEFQRRNGI